MDFRETTVMYFVYVLMKVNRLVNVEVVGSVTVEVTVLAVVDVMVIIIE